jgi:hypothetical protein
MRKLVLALAAVTLSTAGCRLFRDDRPSRSHYESAPASAPAALPLGR